MGAGLIMITIFLSAGCVRPDETAVSPLTPLPTVPVTQPPTPTLAPTRSQPTTEPLPASPTPPPPTATAPPPTPFFTGAAGADYCGIVLPVLPEQYAPESIELNPDPTLLAEVRAAMPQEARPALQQLLAQPHNVSLVAYRLNDPAGGIYLNADQQMPLASIVKLIHLVAYAEAAGQGMLDPTSYVTVETLDQYYLPNYDLRAHPDALEELAAQGLILPGPDRVRLEDVPWMMIRYSSNAAMDYLHMLFGQETIEQTAVALELTSNTAPCTFLGQFLIMGNHTRAEINDEQAIRDYAADATAYSRDVVLFADAFVQDETFRQAEILWHQETRRPRVRDQRLFSQLLNTHGTAREYAALMARLAQNGLSNPESSFLARRYLEWPMIFEANQELFSNLGYKNGALPGVLNTAYYAYPLEDGVPLVVILFYKDLPMSTYRTWRNSLAHDEFARWLLYDPEALPLLRALLSSAS